MFHVQLYLVSGATVTAELDPPLVDKLIGDMLALPNVVPRLLLQLPTRDELEDRAARLRLVAVALGELLSHDGTLQFLAQHARAVVVERTAVAAIEVSDPDPATPSRGQAKAETQRQAAQPVG